MLSPSNGSKLTSSFFCCADRIPKISELTHQITFQVFNQAMAASDSASSSRVPSGEYEVFISFRGPDVRKGFLSHLGKWLRQKNIEVYVDDRLERGEEISSSLVKAIEVSMIALVIFSKDYAFSEWCLEELVKIMERKEDNQQIVIPVFYHVDPSDVRNQKGTYADAFTHLERKFKDNADKLQIWRSVLKKSANLSGHHSTKFPDESKLVDAIVEDVSKKLRDNSPIESNSHLIGLHQNFTSVESLMKLEPKDIVPILGIWGMGGIGKTTLAHAIFDKFLSEFKNYHCFLENVREKSTKIDGLNSLRQKLFSELLKEKDDIDMNDALRRLKGKKVLIVVDDADNPKQLEHLVGGRFYRSLRKDSRILVTSRDKHVLESTGIDEKYIHEVSILNFEESLELFSIRAFKQRQPEMEYQELSKRTVAIAGGVPLALEVLGSHFCCRKKEYWESELRKLKKSPHRDVQNILMISCDGLDAMDKEIFLDIAFFFVGQRKHEIACVLESCGFEAISGIQNLMDKALIKAGWQGRIVMHDLIREMAKQIERENPETRSRINDADELCRMLESNKGTDKIEGIMFYLGERKCLQLEADIFKKMKNLRIIKLLVPVKLHALECFPKELRCLHWYEYPLEYLPSGSCFKNLVELDMRNSNCKKLWDGKQDLGNLKQIALCYSTQLEELPDFSMARRLEIVDLCGCENLKSVHPSILSLRTIVEMYVNDCKRLESLESDTYLESLAKINLEGCSSLKRFCLSSKKLRYIILKEITIEALHFSNGQCTELRSLIVDCDRLSSLQLDGLRFSTNLEQFNVTKFKQEIDTKVLHSLFDAWHNLKCLCLDGWSYLREIPDSIKGLTSLVALSLNGSSVEILPALNDLLSLKYIDLGSNEKLKSILGLPPSLKELNAGECTSLETICSGPLLQNCCGLSFFNCVKLDESSLGFIENLTNSSMTSPFIHNEYYDYHKEYHGYLYEYCLDNTVCYPGSKVPEWMKYKQMTEASRAIEFTYNPQRLDGIVLCCIIPGHFMSDSSSQFFCRISYDDNNKFFHDDYFGEAYHKSDSNHVFLWFMRSYIFRTGSSKDTKISCKFFIKCYNKYWKLEDPSKFIPIEACGVHLIYSLVLESEPEPEKEPELEPSQKRKRVADIYIKDQLPPTKRLNNSGISQPTPLCLATTKSWKCHDDFICHPLQLKFLLTKKQKEVSLLRFL